ncbi:MAG: restriction endonuclease [Nitrospira sp.]|nr:restriction endonuclease [Nitrospira sp.]MDD9860404.1 restriction endonuclease [Nitrospira sp.]
MEQGKQDDCDYMNKRAYILRMFDDKRNEWIREALDSNVIIIGWSDAEGLIGNEDNWEVFRNIVKQSHYSKDSDFRRAGQAAGHLRRFIKMHEGDLVVVPRGGGFYIAKVSGPARYERSKAPEDTAYRRDVEWLNGKKPILRTIARSALQLRMKTQGTTADASDLLPEIKACLKDAKAGKHPTWRSDLRQKQIATVLEEMRSGRINDREFEDHVRDVLLKGLGADTAWVIPRRNDRGADIVATFKVAGGVLPTLTVAVQVKHYRPEPPVGKKVIKQLIHGIEAGPADLGMLVTSGTISKEAEKSAKEYYEESGIQIVLVDGEQLAGIIVDHGLNII